MTNHENIFDRLNEEERLDLQEDARRSRNRFLQLSGIVLKEMLESQLFTTENTPKGEPLEVWVTPEAGAVPTAYTGVGRKCLAFMLEGRSYMSKETERLRVVVPVPKDFNHDDQQAITALREPDEVYTERIKLTNNPGREPEVEYYAVTRERSFQYNPYDPLDSQLGALEDDFMELLQSPSVPDELPTVVQLRLDMVRFKRHAQRSTVMGEPEIEDL